VKLTEVTNDWDNKTPPGADDPVRELRAAQHDVKLLIAKLDKLANPMNEIIRYKNVDIKDPNVNQDYAFMWYNDENQLEAHEIIGMPDDKTRDYVKRIVAQLRYLYTVESKCRRQIGRIPGGIGLLGLLK